jgi:ribonuclease R
MQDKLGEEFTGLITGVTTFGIFVQLDQLFVEGLVHVTDLGADYFQYDDARHELRGERTGKRFQLTDRVNVQVVRVDLEARKIDLRLAGVDAPEPKAPRGKNGAAEFEPAKGGRGNSTPGKTNIKPGPKTQSRYEISTAPKAQPAGKARGGRKTNAVASAAVAPRAAKPVSKSKKKR